MKVSVLLNTYNAERYVGEAIESILSQTLRDFEFLIVDDGSTDGSLAVLQQYARRDGRINVLSRAHTGIVGAHKDGLSRARGEFIARMDADDISVPERLALQVRYLEGHPECVAVGGRLLWVDPEGAPLCVMNCEESHEQIDARHMQGKGGALVHGTSMIRRDALLAVGGYREKFEVAEDLDLFLRLAEYGRLANLPKIALKYRQHFGNTCHTQAQRLRRDTETAVGDAHKRRGLCMADFSMSSLVNPRTKTERHRIWAWWALESGYDGTARKHARKAWLRSPWNPASIQCLFWAHATSLKRKLSFGDSRAVEPDALADRGLGG